MTLEAERTILQIVLTDETGDSYYRMRWPARELAAQRPGWRIVNLDCRAADRFERARDADLLVLFQCSEFDMLPLIEERRARGLKTLVEYNDNFYDPPPSSPVHEVWSSPLLWSTYERFMQLADGVLVTGEGLEALFRDKTDRPIHILKNHHPYPLDDFDSAWVEPRDGLSVGWAGSVGHMPDLIAFIPELLRIAGEFPATHFHFMGNESIPGLMPEIASRLRFVDWGSMIEYFAFWKPVHLGIIPLLDTPYNRCRSDIKAVEMSSRSVLPLVPDAVPYREFIEKTGIRPYRGLAELRDRVREYLANPSRVREEAVRCFEYVRSERLGMSRFERAELYERYFPAKPATTARGEPGSFEVSGQLDDAPPFKAVLVEAQSELKSGRMERAARIVEAAYRMNPLNPELAIAFFRVLRRIDRIRSNQVLESGASDFPTDPRFLIYNLEQEDTESCARVWRSLLDLLATFKPTSRAVFQAECVPAARRALALYPALLELAIETLTLFPDSPELRYDLGHLLSRAGRSAEAQFHFDWLELHRSIVRKHGAFLESLASNYLSTWSEAMKARAAEDLDE